MLLEFLILIVRFTFTSQNTVNYDNYGTFTNSSPFSDPIYRPNADLPQIPSFIDTKFYLYTRNHSNNGSLVTMASQSSYFIRNSRIAFIIHGWLSDSFRPWIFEMKNAILRVENMNVVTVDWFKGAQQTYDQAIANTQIVGIDIANLIDSYVSKNLLVSEDVHIIGHSLGAHVAGFAGNLKSAKIGRITGLDPAGPYFDGMSPLIRLDPTDADFVDVIHTDAEILPIQFGAGIQTSSGHVDFWPNGGRNQPACPTTLMDNPLTTCNHFAAYFYFINSINTKTCQLTAYPCTDFNVYQNGNCTKCTKECNSMGYLASKDKELGNLYLSVKNADCYQTIVYSGSNSPFKQILAINQLILLFFINLIFSN